MASLWSTRRSFLLPRNQRLSCGFVVTMICQLLVPGGAENSLEAEVGGNVSFHCPADPRRPIEFLYFQRKSPLSYINGFHATQPLQNPWENTRMDKSNMTVHMFNLNISHEGVYECLVEYPGSHPSHTIYSLKITANYKKPAITKHSCDKNHCLVSCLSSGGYPSSKITWNVQETHMMKEVNNSNPVKDPVTLTYNVSSIVQFNCSLGELEMISCSVRGMDSEMLSVCASKDPPPQNNTTVIIAVAAIIAAVLCIIMIAVYGMWKAKKRRAADPANRTEQEVPLRKREGAC